MVYDLEQDESRELAEWLEKHDRLEDFQQLTTDAAVRDFVENIIAHEMKERGSGDDSLLSTILGHYLGNVEWWRMADQHVAEREAVLV